MKQKFLVLSVLLTLTACGGDKDSGINLRERFNYPVQSDQTDVGNQTINGIRVPPDPGSANNLTLLGIDADRNGIRDDIDRFIATSFANSPDKKRAAEILGRLNYFNFNKQLPITQAEAQDLIRLRFKNFECFKKEVADEALRDELFELFESLYLNTEERKLFENRISRLAGGFAISIEFDSSKWCTEGMK